MRLTARSEYGLLAMIELAQREGEGPASAREISELQGIPPKYLEQLLVALRKAGLVTASRGARGGFSLERRPSEITVLEIVEALEGPLSSTVCDDERSAACGKIGACAASGVWSRATQALRDVFEATRLSDLALEQQRLETDDTRSA
ncbi:MAG: Rrf2 family transcriptional regulator [Coriobacteriia bacterium]|nr:Rrf2 family transcriptional regulator [Coriobacteriia bacterium]